MIGSTYIKVHPVKYAGKVAEVNAIINDEKLRHCIENCRLHIVLAMVTLYCAQRECMISITH